MIEKFVLDYGHSSQNLRRRGRKITFWDLKLISYWTQTWHELYLAVLRPLNVKPMLQLDEIDD